MPFVKVTDLPATVQTALKAAGYGRQDIMVEAQEAVSVRCSGGNGYRAFAVILNLNTGESRTMMGSWGGENMFTKNQVDSDDTQHALPLGGAVILGSQGGDRPVRCTLYVRPEQIAPLLPAVAQVTERDKAVLACYSQLKSGPYRQEALARAQVSPGCLAGLVKDGLLSVNAAGAYRITTAGKNAIAGFNARL